jgi:hypothetical protein
VLLRNLPYNDSPVVAVGAKRAQAAASCGSEGVEGGEEGGGAEVCLRGGEGGGRHAPLAAKPFIPIIAFWCFIHSPSPAAAALWPFVALLANMARAAATPPVAAFAAPASGRLSKYSENRHTCGAPMPPPAPAPATYTSGFIECPTETSAVSERKSSRVAGSVGHLMVCITAAPPAPKVTTCSSESCPAKASAPPEGDHATSLTHARLASNSAMASPASGSAPKGVAPGAAAPSTSSMKADTTVQE